MEHAEAELCQDACVLLLFKGTFLKDQKLSFSLISESTDGLLHKGTYTKAPAISQSVTLLIVVNRLFLEFGLL